MNFLRRIHRLLGRGMAQPANGVPEQGQIPVPSRGIPNPVVAELASEVAPEYPALLAQVRNAEYESALREFDRLKAKGERSRGIDYLRGFCFQKVDREYEALEALKEELRWYPDHREARRMADSLSARLIPPPTLGNDEFREIYAVVRPYTMLSEKRLHSLYELAWQTCVLDAPGDFVECGVAGGGSSALLATVIARHTKRPRRLFSCDTFSGMPAPTDRDIYGDLPAENSGWGKGTCSAPTSSLTEVCSKLGVEKFVIPVQGLFADTLPGLRERIDSIAFLHMDGDWYESTRDILANLFDKLNGGAVVQMDDYGYWKGSRDAIHEFEKERGLSFEIHDIDSVGVWFSKARTSGERLNLLNLGCGPTYHPGWINLDLVPAGPTVIPFDLKKPLPFRPETFDVVYHSHVLEHLPRERALPFMAECYRVLRSGGLIRVVVPDLESVAELYLANLRGARAGDAVCRERYEWSVLELIDQMVRQHPDGGEMFKYLSKNPVPALDYVSQRFGQEVVGKLPAVRALVEQGCTPEVINGQRALADAQKIGSYRLSGDVHQWMYDSYSLAQLLKAAGFGQIRVVDAFTSEIPEYAQYHLDSLQDGSVRKPDSLFMEARKA